MIETVSVLTLVVALINFGWSLYNFRSIEDIKRKDPRNKVVGTFKIEGDFSRHNVR